MRGSMVAESQATSGARYTLAKPAIELAVAEVRFQAGPGAVPEGTGLAFRDAVRETGLAMDVFEPVIAQELNIEMTPTGGNATSVSAAQGWACRDSATGVAAVVMPFSVAVQTREYVRWSVTFEPILTPALRAVRELLGATLRNRVGLRYVNRFVDVAARTPSDWATRFHPSLLSMFTAGPLAQLAKSGQQQLDLAWDDRTVGTLRHGAFVDPTVNHAYSYLLDIDVSDAATEQFDPANCLELLTAMNRKSAELFRSLLAEDHLDERGLVIEPEEGSAE
jgi:uncharacterized protein (TIGR04255 family)